MIWTPYWILPQNGISAYVEGLIGSGFRKVYVNFGKKFVRVKLQADAPQAYRFSRDQWRAVPQVEDRGQSFKEALASLRPATEPVKECRI